MYIYLSIYIGIHTRTRARTHIRMNKYLLKLCVSAVATVHDGCTRHRRVGYWGDVLSGPFPALALASASPSVTKKENGRSKYVSACIVSQSSLTSSWFCFFRRSVFVRLYFSLKYILTFIIILQNGTQIAQWNLENLLEKLWKSDSNEATSDSSSETSSKSSDTSSNSSSGTNDETDSKSNDELGNESNGSGSTDDGSKSGTSDGTSSEWSPSGEESSGTESGSADGTGTGSSGTNSGSSDETGTGSDVGEKPGSSGDASKSGSYHSSSDISSNCLNDDSVSGSDICSENGSNKGSIDESKAKSQDDQHDKENELKGKEDEGKMTKKQNDVEKGEGKEERVEENIKQDSNGKEIRTDMRNDDFNEPRESRSDPSRPGKKLSSSSQSSTKDEEHRTADNYLRVEGVEVVLLSPARLNDLSSLSEVRWL